MRKVKFLGGLLAAALVAGFNFTSCDEEDLSVDVANVEITPDITVTVGGYTFTYTSNDTTYIELNVDDGVFCVMLTAVDTSSNPIDAAFSASVNGGEVGSLGDLTALWYGPEAEGWVIDIYADADGYVSAQSTVTVPAVVAGTLTVYSVVFTMKTTEDYNTDITEGDAVEDTEVEVEGDTTSATCTLTVDETTGTTTGTADIYVPTSASYLTSEQIEVLDDAIDALEGPTGTRAASELENAKSVLHALVAAYATEPVTQKLGTYSIIVDDITVQSLTLTYQVTYTTYECEITFTYDADSGNYYEVTGTATKVDETSIVVNYGDCEVTTLAGETYTHSHSHTHGDSSTSGGGTAE